MLNKRRDRPCAGLREGERATDYPSLMIRLPPETKGQLKALSRLRREPIWRVLHEFRIDGVKLRNEHIAIADLETWMEMRRLVPTD